MFEALKFPDKVYEDVEHGVTIAVKKVDAKSVIIAYKVEDETVKVITVYYTTKLDRLIESKMVGGPWKKVK